MSKKTKRFRVATSGPTVDGREIKPEWLKQAAANYDPALYAARINVEHLRGYGVNSDFGAFGDVIALHAETNKDGRVELYAEIEPNEKAIAANKAGQKVYTSVELIPNFAGTGEAYMVGLALTDSPASLGTERLTFSAQQVSEGATYTAKPWGAWGQQAAPQAFGLATPIDAAELTATDGDTTSAAASLAAKFADLRAGLAAKFGRSDKATATLASEVMQTMNDMAEHTAAAVQKMAADLAATTAAHNKLADEFASLKKQLEATPADNATRPKSTGGQASAGNQYQADF